MANETKKIYKLRNTVLNIGMVSILFFTSCATTYQKNNQKISSKILIQKTAQLVNKNDKPISPDLIRLKLNQFKQVLNNKTLTKADWKLHDELLDYYIRLKNKSTAKIIVPAGSRLTRSFETYCLNAGKAAPQSKEIYHWQKSEPGIHYYNELLKVRRQNQITQHDLQELLWNLQSETKWDDYPSHHKSVLLKIDSQAMLKLPSQLKGQTQNLVKDLLLDMPGASDAYDTAQNTYGLIQGKYYQYDEFKKSINNLSSKEFIGDENELTAVPDTELYVKSESEGYSSQQITFYNPTNHVQELNIENYYLAPERKDVQWIGINPIINEDSSLLTDLEKTLFETMVRLGVGFTPGLNDAADVYELLTGNDFISGKNLSIFEQALSGVGVIVGSGATYRYAKRVIFSPVEYIDDFSDGLGAVTKKNIKINAGVLVNSKIALAQATTKTDLLKNQINSIKDSLELLKKNNVSRSSRREVIEAFSKNSKVVKLQKDTEVYRYSSEGRNLEKGRWVSPPHFGQPGGGRQIYIPNPEVLK